MALTTSYQLLAQAELGKVYNSNKAYIRLYAKYNSQSIENNTSNISIQARLYNESTWYASSGTYYRITGSGSIDSGNISCLTSASNMWSKGEVVLGTQTKNIEHNSDGSRSIHAEAQFVSSPWGWNVTASATDIELPKIPRASSVSCSSPYIGDTATITVSKKSSSFTSTVTYKIGTLTGTLATKTSETVLSLDTESLKEEIYALIPNAKSISGTITCTTYSGSTQVGSPTTANFNLYAKEDECKPIISGTITDTNESTIALTGDNSIIVKNASKPKITVNATAQYSSSISSYTINLNDGQITNVQEYTFDTINSSKVTISATDTRGYSNSYDIDLTDRIIDYLKLHFDNISLSRPEGTSNEVQLTANGVWYNGNFSENILNTLSVKFQYKESDASEWIEGSTLNPTIDGNTFSFDNLSLGDIYDYGKEYQFKIIATDLLNTVGATDKESITVPKGQEVVAIGDDTVWVYGELFVNDTEILMYDVVEEWED